jgi:uncharacterized membrane protein
MTLKSLKPAVTKSWLIALAGLMWTGAGLMLCRLAYNWLAIINIGIGVTFGVLGVVMALGAYHFGFSKITQKNIERLNRLTEKTCVFAFQTWKSYLIIMVMIILGAFIRSTPISKTYLAVLYTTIGGALLLASFLYYRLLWQMLMQKESRSN